MPKPAPTRVWLAPRACSHTAEFDGRGRWHACGCGWHREWREGVHLLVRPVQGGYQARVEDDAGEALALDGANFTEWEYPTLERARMEVEHHALKVALEKGLLRR